MASILWRAALTSTKPNGDFIDSLYEFFSPLEAATLAERLNPSLVQGNVTIGIGFDLNAGGKDVVIQVLIGLGFDPETVRLSTPPTQGTPQYIEYQYIKNIRDAITAKNISQLTTIMAGRAQNSDSTYSQWLQGRGLTRKTSFTFSNDDEVRNVFRNLWNDSYKQGINSLIPETTAMPASTSQEMMVLASLKWHGMLGPKLAKAINDGNRAEAWFEIRYGWSIPAQGVPGFAKRQYLEATVFGLYNNGTSAVDINEAISVYQMFAKNRARILDYEITRNFQASAVSSANTALDTTAFASLTVNKLSDELQTAANFLNDQYRQGHAAFDPLNIQLATDSTSIMPFNLLVGEDTTAATGHNDDLLIGSSGRDVLWGYGGSDVLQGLGGNDELAGGAGDDILVGGEGDDNYQFTTGDGNDTIVDTQGEDKLYIDGQLITYGYHQQGDADTIYHSADDKLIFTISGTDLVIKHKDTSITDIITIKNYDKNAKTLGIDLNAVQTVGYNNSLLSDLYYKAVAWFNDSTNAGGASGSIGGGGSYSVPAAISGALVLSGVIDPDEPGGYAFDRTTGSQSEIIFAGTPTSIQGLINSVDGVGKGKVSDDGIAYTTFYEGQGGDDILVGFLPENLYGNLLYGNLGNDLVIGSEGNDTLWGDFDSYELVHRDVSRPGWIIYHYGPDASGSDYTYVDNGVDNYTLQEHDSANDGNDFLDGGDGDDAIEGNGGDDVLIGGYGNDVLSGDSGNDHLSGGDGNDKLYGDYVPGGAGAPVSSKTYDDVLDGGSGDDSLVGGYGADQLYGGMGNDVLVGDNWLDGLAIENRSHGNDYLDGGDGDDTLVGFGGGDTLLGGVGNDELYGDDDNSANATAESDDFLDGGDGNDKLVGHAGSDTLLGGSGDDQLFSDDESGINPGNDFLDGGDGNDHLDGGAGNDLLLGGNGDDVIYGKEGADTLVGGSGADYLNGGAGNDTYILSIGDSPITSSAENIDDVEGSNLIVFSNVDSSGVSLARSGSGIFLQYSQSDVLYITGGYTNPSASLQFLDQTISLRELIGDAMSSPVNDSGSEGNDQLVGGASSDSLSGGGGDDILYGGKGNDELRGGEGSDTYYFSRGGGQDSIGNYDSSADMPDTILFGEDIDPDDIELSRGGLYAESLIIKIKDTTDSIDVLFNFDTAKWSASQAYRIDNISFSNGVSWDLSEIYRRVYTGNDESQKLYCNDEGGTIFALGGNDIITGGEGDDFIDGGDGDDDFFGGGGVDTLVGGKGNDTYVLSGNDDVIIEQGDQGIDLVMTNDSYVIPDNIENVSLTSDWNSSVAGNSLDNYIIGNYGWNVLVGGGGNDTLMGGFGNDVYQFEAGFGQDTIKNDDSNGVYSVDYIRFGESITPDMVALSREGDNLIVTVGSEKITVADHFAVGGGTTQNFSRAIDGIKFSSGAIWSEQNISAQLNMPQNRLPAGVDDVQSALKNLPIVINTADLLANDTDPDGNTLSITGIADWQHGMASWDSATGTVTFYPEEDYIGDASFTYIVSDGILNVTAKVIISLQPSIYNGTAGDDIYKGTLADDTAYGYAGNDTLSTLDGKDILDGGAGADILIGGAGDDTYFVENAADVVIEDVNSGADTVLSNVSVQLAENVESLVLAGSASINGVGNSLDNLITGNNGNNTLDGGAGNDSLIGGEGNDVYVIDNATDVIIENANEGVDIVRSAITYTLGNNLENLTLTGTAAIKGTGNSLDNWLIGNSAANTLTGGAGNDILDGGAGTDRLVGGTGDDSYFIDVSSDVIVENASEGTDTVFSAFTYTLGSNLENLTLAGSAAINGTGNTLNNVILGNSANNILSGGTGADTMIGGLGDDSYIVDNTADVIVENVSEGTDNVSSSVTYTLNANVENLTLSGTTAINGTGNASDNTLTGNSAVNILTGGAGNDVLNGGTGADTMIGGIGNDTLFVDNASDVVTENASEGTDTISSSITLTLGNNVENLILTGTSALNGTGNTLNNSLTGNSAANTLTGAAGDDILNGLSGADRMVGGTGNDTYFVDIGTDVIVENAGEGTDTVNSAITYTLGTNLENLTLTGTTAINGTGNTLANVLTGNSATNTLTGAAGNDTYVIGRGSAADTIVETDSTAGNTDVLAFLSGVATDQLWFRHVGNNLEVSIIGTSDSSTISNWYGGSNNHVEQFKTADGKVLLDSQVENLVSAMAAFAPPSAGQTTLPQNYQDQLGATIAANWH